MAASLLEGGPTSVGVPVEFVQGGCDQPEGYVPTGKATASVSVAYSPVASAAKASTQQQLDSSVLLHHNSVMTRSVTQQPVAMEDSQTAAANEVAVTPTVTNTAADLTQVLSGLQHGGDLNSVLQQQPALAEGISAIAAGEVSVDPENLRFQYELSEDLEPTPAAKTSKKQKPVVYREQDRFLPIHNVARIMRNAIPRNGKVSKDAKECMQECVSEFISFITSEASDKCIAEKRKTITGDDILVAMATLGFDNYIDPLKFYLQKYREFTKAEKVAGNGTTTGVTGIARQSSLTGNPVQMTGHMMGQQSVMEMGGSMSPSGVPQATQQPMATGYSYGSYGAQVLPNTPT